MVGSATLAKLESQIEALSLQMNDVLSLLWSSQTNPGMHTKLSQLFRRLEVERERLEMILSEARRNGVESLRWSELVAKIAGEKDRVLRMATDFPKLR